NSVTNKIYVADWCGTDPSCTSGGAVTVIDGATENTLSVHVGYYPYGVAVNPVTNRIYVANQYGNDPTGSSPGTVSVIDGASNTVIATVTTGSRPYSVAVNSVTNQIYVPNNCGNDVSCRTKSGTLTVIDGASNTVTATVAVGSGPVQAVVNSITNKIYVPNPCGNDPTCTTPYSGGTVTIIDGATNNPTSVNVGIYPYALDVNSATNKIYVANQCGDDPRCGSATMTAIDGATLATTDIGVGHYPYGLALNSATNLIYVPNYYDNTVSVMDGTPITAL